MEKLFQTFVRISAAPLSVPATVVIRMAAIAVVLAGITICHASRIDRLDIYDNSDNHLLFVTFAYDSAGANIGRSVFASDSTFLRSTTFQPSGTSVKETSIDFDANLVFSTTIGAAAGAKTPFSTVDQFGLEQFGGGMNFTLTSTNNYDISQNNVTSYKEQYQFAADGSLSRINILDKNGSVIYYAVSTSATGVTARPRAAARFSVSINANRGYVKVVFGLVHTSHVCLDLYSPAGRRIAALLDKNLDSGNHAFALDGRGRNVNPLGNGACICRLTLDGVTVMAKKIVLQK
jgi:hypothetical protein